MIRMPLWVKSFHMQRKVCNSYVLIVYSNKYFSIVKLYIVIICLPHRFSLTTTTLPPPVFLFQELRHTLEDNYGLLNTDTNTTTTQMTKSSRLISNKEDKECQQEQDVVFINYDALSGFDSRIGEVWIYLDDPNIIEQVQQLKKQKQKSTAMNNTMNTVDKATRIEEKDISNVV